MCGRYTLTRDLEVLQPRFRFSAGATEFRPRYNLAPSQDAPAVIRADSRVLRVMRWGLIPSWAKEEDIGSRLINARAETVAEKPSFRNSLKRRRCLVLADSFYEWRKAAQGGRKIPMRVMLTDEAPFAFAGLWDAWRNTDAQEISSFTIITTEANDLVRSIHDRMPVILPESHEDRWLDPDADVNDLLSLLKPFPPDRMKAYEVSTTVNSPANDDPRCISPVVADKKPSPF